MKTGLQAGFARANINPPMGIDVNGYYVKRNAEGILDDLEVNAVAVRNGDKTILLMAIDNVGIGTNYPTFMQAISERTSLPIEAIFLHCTHTHTGPSTIAPLGCSKGEGKEQELIDDYRNFLLNRCLDVATFAIADLKPAKMGYGVG